MANLPRSIVERHGALIWFAALRAGARPGTRVLASRGIGGGTVATRLVEREKIKSAALQETSVQEAAGWSRPPAALPAEAG